MKTINVRSKAEHTMEALDCAVTQIHEILRRQVGGQEVDTVIRHEEQDDDLAEWAREEVDESGICPHCGGEIDVEGYHVEGWDCQEFES